MTRSRRQLKKLNKRSNAMLGMPDYFERHAWASLCDQYRGFHIMQTGNIWPRPKETPSLIYKWARENLDT